MEYKSLLAKIGEIDVKGQRVSGYFSVFGNVDSDGDILMPGAFAKTIGERGPKGTNQIPHLLQHNTYQPLGKPTILEERSFGGYFETDIVDTDYGIDTIKFYAAGVYNEHSFGFQTLGCRDSEREGKYCREITEVKLWEISTVTFGANDLTRFDGFKSMTKGDKIDRVLERIELLTKAITDNKFSAKGQEFIQLQFMQLNDLMKSLRDEKEPAPVTPEVKEPTVSDLANIFRNNLKSNLNG